MEKVKTWQKVTIAILALALVVILGVVITNLDNNNDTAYAQKNTKYVAETEPSVENDERNSIELADEMDSVPAASSKKVSNNYYDARQVITSKPKQVNVYYNPNNIPVSGDNIQIAPACLYYKDGSLHAVCYVKNMSQKTMEILSINDLAFANSDGWYAESSFDDLNGAVLAPGQYGLYEFVFSEGTFSKTDLSQTLRCYSNVNWRC